jgi:hypothetical protein
MNQLINTANGRASTETVTKADKEVPVECLSRCDFIQNVPEKETWFCNNRENTKDSIRNISQRKRTKLLQ